MRDLRPLDGKRRDAKPIGIGMVGGLARRAFAKKEDVGDDGGAFTFEGVGGQADRPNKVGLVGQVLADAGILLVEREMRCDQGQHAAGLQGVDRLGEEKIVQGKLLPVIVELHVGERHVADHGVDFGQSGVAEVFDADVGIGMQRLGDAAGDGVHLDADKACPWLAVAHEIAGAAAGFQDGGVAGNAEAGDGLVDGSDDGRRRVEGVEGGALGAVVFLGRKQRLQLLAECLPAGILVAAGDRVGEYREGDRPEAGEAGERLLLLQGGGPLLLLDALEGADGGEDVAGFGFFAAGDGNRCRWRGVFKRGSGRIGRVGGFGGCGVVVTAGCGVSFGSGGSGGAGGSGSRAVGLRGWESNSVGCRLPRVAVIRAA